jgi:hypothetical protein
MPDPWHGVEFASAAEVGGDVDYRCSKRSAFALI